MENHTAADQTIEINQSRISSTMLVKLENITIGCHFFSNRFIKQRLIESFDFLILNRRTNFHSLIRTHFKPPFMAHKFIIYSKLHTSELAVPALYEFLVQFKLKCLTLADYLNIRRLPFKLGRNIPIRRWVHNWKLIYLFINVFICSFKMLSPFRKSGINRTGNGYLHTHTHTLLAIANWQRWIFIWFKESVEIKSFGRHSLFEYYLIHCTAHKY